MSAPHVSEVTRFCCLRFLLKVIPFALGSYALCEQHSNIVRDWILYTAPLFVLLVGISLSVTVAHVRAQNYSFCVVLQNKLNICTCQRHQPIVEAQYKLKKGVRTRNRDTWSLWSISTFHKVLIRYWNDCCFSPPSNINFFECRASIP